MELSAPGVSWPSTTWDGVAVAPEPPYGAMIVVVRGDEVLLLRRVAAAANPGGEWLWTPPSGARRPGESIDACAARELLEETGLGALDSLEVRLVTDAEWHVYRLDVPGDCEVRTDAEHDAYRWVAIEEAVRMCRPQVVADGLASAWAARP